MSAQPLELMRERAHELGDLAAAGALLSWDQETMLPPGGAPARAEQLATLDRLHHERLVADDLGRWLEQVAQEELPAPDAALVRVLRRDREKALRVPAELVAALARAGSLGQHVWARARAENDFASFAGPLSELIELRRRYAACFEDSEHPYDALLDDFEPGMRTAQLREVLGQLREGLVPLVDAIAAAPGKPEPITGDFEVSRQQALVLRVLHQLGFDEQRFRLDESAHPFSSGTSPGDQRITTRYDPRTLEALYSCMHEFGHALYEAQIDPALSRTPLSGGVSMGIHESQSRMWENMVGRSRPFADFVLPHVREAFPDALGGLDAGDFYRRVNAVQPSLIRVQADEVTYNLHIALRFELELELFEGRLEPAALPAAWNERMLSYLGVEVPRDAEGVLQDIHWSGGMFGYFPTYSLGNVIAAQLWRALRAELGDIDQQIAAGDFAPLREWLRERVHRHGRSYTPAQTLERAIGEQIDPQPLLDYLWEKHADVHGITRPG